MFDKEVKTTIDISFFEIIVSAFKLYFLKKSQPGRFHEV
jgi:hypothetical protein